MNLPFKIDISHTFYGFNTRGFPELRAELLGRKPSECAEYFRLKVGVPPSTAVMGYLHEMNVAARYGCFD